MARGLGPSHPAQPAVEIANGLRRPRTGHCGMAHGGRVCAVELREKSVLPEGTKCRFEGGALHIAGGSRQRKLASPRVQQNTAAHSWYYT